MPGKLDGSSVEGSLLAICSLSQMLIYHEEPIIRQFQKFMLGGGGRHLFLDPQTVVIEVYSILPHTHPVLKSAFLPLLIATSGTDLKEWEPFVQLFLRQGGQKVPGNIGTGNIVYRTLPQI